MQAAEDESGSGGSRVLLAALLLLAAVACLEPTGSGLAEPDETRYAEVPREMLAAGDLAVPRLNGLPYFEKPPMLYWANAASFRLFGQTPRAARLPTRVAGLGTVFLVVLAAARGGDRRRGLAAGIFLLASPIGFLMARTNLTDGLLVFFFTATLLAGRAAILRFEATRPWIGLAALTGAAAAAAFLTKGLIAIALPGAILLAWALATGRFRALVGTLFLSPTPVVFLALAAPWFLLVERRYPGFLRFFFVYEHFQRFATGAAKRSGPVYYFVPVFLLGFLPGLPFFFRGLKRAWRRGEEGIFFALWFALVFVFFSLSKSKLPPYLFPAIPAAAILAAAGLPPAGPRRAWIVQALCATALAAALLFHPMTRAEMMRFGLPAIVAPAFALLVVLSWTAVLVARNAPALALSAVAASWAAFLSAAVLGWPRVAPARFTAELAAAARTAAAPGHAAIVGYKDYLNGVSWELKRAIPVAAYRGELEPEFETRPEIRDSLIWSPDKFWSLWKSDRPVVALVRLRDLVEMMTAAPPARVVRWAGSHAVVANFPEPAK